ncbi:MAG: phosphatase PAP2 family protein [Syntrophales bacterium]
MNWELKFMKWGVGSRSSRFLYHVLPWVTHLGSHFAVILFVLVSCITTKQLRVLFSLLLLYAVQSFVIYFLKFTVRRKRPLSPKEIKIRVSKGPGEIIDPSFPSAHTAFSFMMAAVLAFYFPRYQVIFFLIASFIGWTRVYLGLHYPTDVIAGAILGYGITRAYIFFYFSR